MRLIHLITCAVTTVVMFINMIATNETNPQGAIIVALAACTYLLSKNPNEI